MRLQRRAGPFTVLNRAFLKNSDDFVLDRITKRFGKQTAVDALSFEVPAGQIVGFLGPNGAGKSTTLENAHGHDRAQRRPGHGVRV